MNRWYLQRKRNPNEKNSYPLVEQQQ
uniref:Uncharacterized protein n=1 Tax=Rhizophora mucronata TaxID=61149 RepID=A0A2P2PEC4_RHIMU